MASLDLPQELPEATKTFTAQCFCKATHFTITLPTAALPLPVHLCHCSICRYTHGALCSFHAPLPKGVEPVFVAPSSESGSLTSYRHATAQGIRFFCSTCGCHIGDKDVDPDPETGMREWRVATSVFPSAEAADAFQIRTHTNTLSAPGGALHDWLPRLGDRELRIWNPTDGSEAPVVPEAEVDDQGNERLRAECHCGGVSFTVPRPTAVPAGHPSEAAAKRYASKLHPDKWAGCLDLCDDCRLVTGSHVAAWTFVPLGLTEPRVPQDLKFGTLKTFSSSPDVVRAFCGVCGATVIFKCDERIEDEDWVVDVAIGLLRAPEGVAAEKWLTWRTRRISWYDSGERYDPVLAKSLKEGLDAWGVEKYGESLNFKIG